MTLTAIGIGYVIMVLPTAFAIGWVRRVSMPEELLQAVGMALIWPFVWFVWLLWLGMKSGHWAERRRIRKAEYRAKVEAYRKEYRTAFGKDPTNRMIRSIDL